MFIYKLIYHKEKEEPKMISYEETKKNKTLFDALNQEKEDN
ncbi:MAG: hypothetical protein ABIB47_03800 [Candidatus Woesearchaeota archaeon]